MEFENFKAYDEDYVLSEDSSSALYLIILNERGYDDAYNWIIEECTKSEASLLKKAESCYYEFDEDIYKPIDENKIPHELASAFYAFHGEKKKSTNEISQKFKIKIQLVNGVTIEPNLYSNNHYEIASIIQTLSGEKLFAGQIKNINIELS